MCCLDCILVFCFLLIVLAVQTAAFIGFLILAFGLSMIGVGLLLNNTHLSINYTVWIVVGLIILSHLSEGCLLAYDRSGMKGWFDKRKQASPIFLSKVPVLIYFALYWVAIVQIYYQHPLIKSENSSNLTNASSVSVNRPVKIKTFLGKEESESENPSHEKFSLMFLLSMSYIVYMVAGSSDWILYLSNPTTIRTPHGFNMDCILNCIGCILLDFLNTFLNPFLLGIYALPVALEYFQFSTCCIMAVGMIGVSVAAFLKVDKGCQKLRTPHSAYSEENKVFVKSLNLQHVWFPLVVVWFMKDWKDAFIPPEYRLSDRKDFAICVSLLCIALFKAFRNVTVQVPCSSLCCDRFKQIDDTDEPISASDNTLRKVTPKSAVVPPTDDEQDEDSEKPTGDFISKFPTGAIYMHKTKLANAAERNFNNNAARQDRKNNNDSVSARHQQQGSEEYQIQPSAPPAFYEVLHEIDPSGGINARLMNNVNTFSGRYSDMV